MNNCATVATVIVSEEVRTCTFCITIIYHVTQPFNSSADIIMCYPQQITVWYKILVTWNLFWLEPVSCQISVVPNLCNAKSISTQHSSLSDQNYWHIQVPYLFHVKLLQWAFGACLHAKPVPAKMHCPITNWL